MGAKNKVLEGDYKGNNVSSTLGEAYICIPVIGEFNPKRLQLNKSTIECYEIIDEAKKKSAAGIVGLAAVGAALVGPLGLLAAGAAKNKGSYLIAIKFKDGKNSLIEVDDKIKKAIISKTF